MNLSLFLQPEIIAVLLIVGAGVIFYFYLEKLNQERTLWERIAKIQSAYTADKISSAFTPASSLLQKLHLTYAKDLLRQTSIETAKKYRLRFEQAGWDSQDAPLIVSIINIGLILLGFFVYLYLVFDVENISNLPFIYKIGVFLIISFASIRSFEYFLDFVIKHRYEKIREGLSYAIDLMSICTRSGFGLEKSFEKIAEEMSQYNKDLCKEFTKTAIELAIIPERNIALRNLAQRVNIPVVQILASGLIQAEEQGAPLSNTLRIMSTEFSKQKMLEVEAKATKLPALLTLPLILFLLPAMMIVLLGPAVANLFRGGYL
jgi:tight adherence protein C